jgi:hypothetical protein
LFVAKVSSLLLQHVPCRRAAALAPAPRRATRRPARDVAPAVARAAPRAGKGAAGANGPARARVARRRARLPRPAAFFTARGAPPPAGRAVRRAAVVSAKTRHGRPLGAALVAAPLAPAGGPVPAPGPFAPGGAAEPAPAARAPGRQWRHANEQADGAACRAALRDAGARFRPLPDVGASATAVGRPTDLTRVLGPDVNAEHRDHFHLDAGAR